MTYRGYIRDGNVVLEEQVPLAEGTRVEVAVIAAHTNREFGDKPGPQRRGLMKFAGICTGLPEDASTNLEHYLYHKRCP